MVILLCTIIDFIYGVNDWSDIKIHLPWQQYIYTLPPHKHTFIKIKVNLKPQLCLVCMCQNLLCILAHNTLHNTCTGTHPCKHTGIRMHNYILPLNVIIMHNLIYISSSSCNDPVPYIQITGFTKLRAIDYYNKADYSLSTTCTVRMLLLFETAIDPCVHLQISDGTFGVIIFPGFVSNNHISSNCGINKAF